MMRPNLHRRIEQLEDRARERDRPHGVEPYHQLQVCFDDEPIPDDGSRVLRLEFDDRG